MAASAGRLWDRSGDAAAAAASAASASSSSGVPQRMKQYTRVEKIGQGTYGEVYKATSLSSGTETHVALKRVRLEDDDTGVPLSAIREVASLKHLKHPNIVTLLDMVLEDNVLWLVFEFMQGDLWSVLEKTAPSGLDYATATDYLRQLLLGVAYCHHNQVLHRDIKPGNLLLDAKGTIKLCDFGMSRPLRNHVQPYSPGVVTLWYRPPELLLGKPFYSTSVDVWSLGCVFLEMVTGHPPFRGDSKLDQLYRIFQILGTPDERVWPGLTDFDVYREAWPVFPPTPLSSVAPKLCPSGVELCQSMLRYCPDSRVSASAALEHPLFARLQRNGAAAERA